MARVLILEDMKDVSTAMQEIVQAAGHDVTLCKDGDEGIDKLETEAFDLVITDIVMPERDGLEVLRYIRQELPRETSMPVIAVSGGGMAINPKIALDAAKQYADIVLKKPFKAHELRESIDQLLEDRKQKKG